MAQFDNFNSFPDFVKNHIQHMEKQISSHGKSTLSALIPYSDLQNGTLTALLSVNEIVSEEQPLDPQQAIEQAFEDHEPGIRLDFSYYGEESWGERASIIFYIYPTNPELSFDDEEFFRISLNDYWDVFFWLERIGERYHLH